MKKNDKISVINTFFNSNETLATLALGGITDKKVALVSKRVNREDIKATYIDDVHKALKTIADALTNYDETISLVGSELWDYYKMMDVENFEMIQYKIAIKMLNNAWATKQGSKELSKNLKTNDSNTPNVK